MGASQGVQRNFSGALLRLLSAPQFSPRRVLEAFPPALGGPAVTAAGVGFPRPQPAPAFSPGSATRAPGASKNRKKEGKTQCSGLAVRRPGQPVTGPRVVPERRRALTVTHTHTHTRGSFCSGPGTLSQVVRKSWAPSNGSSTKLTPGGG